MAEATFDYLVIGGGASGAIVARRLAEDGRSSVCLLEAGPSDEGLDQILDLKRNPELYGGAYDCDYAIESQARCNSLIRQGRARILGGCTSHNQGIAFRALDHDLCSWEAGGATSWGPAGTRPYFDRLETRVHIDRPTAGNPVSAAFIEAGQQAGFPLIRFGDGVRDGVGWFEISVRDGIRQSSSVAYLHPLSRLPPTLTVMTETEARRILFDHSGAAREVESNRGTVRARREILVCAGVFDTPKLLMLSGIGPGAHLRAMGIPVVADLPAVGEHLLDHPFSQILYEATRVVPRETLNNFSDAAMFATIERGAAAPEVMFHFLIPAYERLVRYLGYPVAEDNFAIGVNVSRAVSEGQVRLRAPDPAAPPVIDPRYLTDPDGYDERMLLAGLKLAREVAGRPALAAWIKRELMPGPEISDDDALADYARRALDTSYTPGGHLQDGPGRRSRLRSLMLTCA